MSVICPSVYWPLLSEEGKYIVWSLHLEAGGEPMTYSAFCDRFDEIQAKVDA